MPNLKNKTKFNSSSIPKNVGWLEKYGDGGETDPPFLEIKKPIIAEAESTGVAKPNITNINLNEKHLSRDRESLNYMHALQLLKKHNVTVDSSGNILKDIGLPSSAYYNPITRTINYNPTEKNKRDYKFSLKKEYTDMIMKELPHAIQSDSLGTLKFLKNTIKEGISDVITNKLEKTGLNRYDENDKIEGHAHNVLEQKLIKERNKALGYDKFNYNLMSSTTKKEMGGWLEQYGDGGDFNDYKRPGPVEDRSTGMTGMMKSKIATEAHYGNPSALRMVSPNPNKYTFTGEEEDWKGNQASPAGSYGTHFMGSFGNQARPGLQEVNGKMQYFQNPQYNSKENFNFSRPEDAEYFANYYKEVAPMMRNYKEYKYGGLLNKYAGGGETDPPGGLKNNQWMGANLNKEGYITSETKGGNRISFTGDQKADDFFNKQIDSGKWGFDPKNPGVTFLLKKPVKGLSKEDQFMATKEYHDLRAPKGFTNESQKQQIAKLPKFQQDIINAENEKRRKKVVSDSMQEVGKHPLFYAPGIIGAAPFAVAGLSEAGMASAPYIQGALSTQLPGMANVPGATVGKAIGSMFIGHGAAHITPDAIEMYKNPSWSNAGSIAMDVAEISPLIRPLIGPTSKFIGEGLNTAGKYLTEETALKNAWKLNSKAFKENPEAYYRGVGEKGLKNAQETNSIISRDPKYYTSPYFSQQGDFRMAQAFNDNVIVEAKGKSLYDDLSNLNKDDLVFTRSNMGNVPLKHSSLSKVTPGVNLEGNLADIGLESIPLNNPNIRVLKKDWWQRYKPIEFNKNTPSSSNVDFSKYLTQEEAVAARGERLISQKNKPGWNEQLTPELEQRLSTAVERHNPASDLPGESLGVNSTGRTGTEVSKNAISEGIPLNEANKARIAAHETGHYYTNSPEEGAEWLSHFDLSKLSGKIRKYFKGNDRFNNYANEIRERAAQLKDYISQKNKIPLNKDFTITETMLDDAIKNYVKDTGLNNSMSEMLGALKNKKGLLKTMNKFALVSIPAVIGAEALQNKQDNSQWLDKYK